jgi:hypothetical protein
MVFTTGLVSDGVFDPDDAEMVTSRDHFDALTKVGVIEADDSGLYRIHPDYQSWQTTAAELQRQAARRDADRVRKQQSRSAHEMQPEEPW